MVPGLPWFLAGDSWILSTAQGHLPALHAQFETKTSPNKRLLSPLGFLAPYCKTHLADYAGRKFVKRKVIQEAKEFP